MVGASGLKVSEICLGVMNFGDSTDERQAASIMAAARDAGVNFVDTADGYHAGKSEAMVGKLLRRDRADWVLATKVGQAPGTPRRKRGLSRKWMMEAIDHSLERLQTDHVDIYYMHHVDWETPLAESVATMGDIIGQGTALHWGFSNHRPWQVAELIRLCDATATPRPVICQPLYNAVLRMPENDLLPACEYFGIGVAPYSPLARGVLSGKYDPAKTPPRNSRAARGDASILNRDFRPETFEVIEKIRAHAAQRGMSVLEFAILWLLNNRIVTSVIAGPRNVGQLKAYLGALGHEFNADDEALMDTLVAAGHPSTPGFNDPRYPPQGRKPRT